MLRTDNIVVENMNEYDTVASKFQFESNISSCLGLRERRKYNRLRHRISEIISTIEEESGWKYLNRSFVLLSDYTYNPDAECIEFERNEVLLSNGEVKSSRHTQREMHFIERYFELLLKVSDYEKEKDAIECRFDNGEAENVIPIEEIRHPKEEKIRKDTEYSNASAVGLLRTYGNDAVTILLSWLKRLSQTNYPMDQYKTITSTAISKQMKDTLLSWLATYSYAGEKIYMRYLEEKEKQQLDSAKVKIIEFPYIGEDVDI